MGDSLEEIFRVFCSFGKRDALPLMDGAKFAKMCRDAKLMDKRLTATEVDIIFTKAKPKSERKMSLADFHVAVDMLAGKKYPGDPSGAEKIRAKLTSVEGPSIDGTTEVSRTYVMERMTDTSKYTGTHKNRFDAEGRGRGLEGRDPAAKGRGHVPSLVSGRSSYVTGCTIGIDAVDSARVEHSHKTSSHSPRIPAKQSLKTSSSSPRAATKPSPKTTTSSPQVSSKLSPKINSSPQVSTKPGPKTATSSPRVSTKPTSKTTTSSPQVSTKPGPKTATSSPRVSTKSGPKTGSCSPGLITKSNPKSSPKPQASSPRPRGKGDIYDRLTDTSKYTGTHKHRFDETGRGKGMYGRDLPSKGPAMAPGSASGLPSYVSGYRHDGTYGKK